MLERYAMKVARTVLRGGSGSNATPLPDHADPSTGFRQAQPGGSGQAAGSPKGDDVHSASLRDDIANR
jgi:hypothetical protein